MLHDLDKTIEALLKAELPAELGEESGPVSIGFATPDEAFPPPSLALPAINLFLFQVLENRELRSFQPSHERRGSEVLQTPAPAFVDCHYLVTACARDGSLDLELNEHRLLGAAMRILLRHKRLPSDVLQGALAGQEPPLRSAVMVPGSTAGMEIWQSLRGKPRTALHYVVTTRVDVHPSTSAGRAVSSVEARLAQR